MNCALAGAQMHHRRPLNSIVRQLRRTSVVIAEVIAEVAGGALRWLFAEFILGVLIKGPGYAVLRLLKHQDQEFDRDGTAIVVGLFFWIVAVLVGLGIYAVVKNGAV